MHNDTIWSYVFVLAFVATALVETFWPRSSLRTSSPRRWICNFILFLLSAATSTFAAIAFAYGVRSASFGALNRFGLPYAARFAIGIAALDFASYAAHRLLHAVTPLWRAHQVHHSETDLDLTTGLRFHPLEAFFRQCLYLPMIALLGVPPGAVAAGKLAVVVLDFVQHGNFRFPETADRILRLLFVTPAVHRAHHSQAVPQQNTNFGTLFSVWDRMFGTYGVGDSAASAERRYGLAELADGSELNAAQLLGLPFASKRTILTASSVSAAASSRN